MPATEESLRRQTGVGDDDRAVSSSPDQHKGFEGFRRIGEPTPLLVGDRDEFCSPEEAVLVHRLLAGGELAILPNLPNLGHALSAQVTD